MLDNRPASAGSIWGHADSTSVDMALRAYMLSVYNYMAVGVGITGVMAWVVYLLSVTTPGASDAVAVAQGGLALTSFGYALFVSPLKWAVMLAPVGIVLWLSFGIHRMQTSTAQAVFWLYAALVGVSLSTLMIVYTGQSIASVFFVTAAAFGGLSLYGYTTERSLSGFGSFLIMGLIGIMVGGLVNVFVQSSAFQFAMSVIGVVVFAGLTAYDTQRIKNEYIYYIRNASNEDAGRSAVMGALSLYLDFINLFVTMMQLFGQRRD